MKKFRALALSILGLVLALPAAAQLPGGGLNIPTTPVTGGTSGQCLYINSGKLGSQACGGVPSGAAGGDLTGTYPNPTIKASVSLTTPNINVATGTSLALAASLSTATSIADTGYSYQTPTTGFSITLSGTVFHTIIDPAGTLATGTITMPAAPVDGQIVDVRFSQIVTALTISPNVGQSVKGSPTSTAVGSQYTAIYRAANTTWYF